MKKQSVSKEVREEWRESYDSLRDVNLADVIWFLDCLKDVGRDERNTAEERVAARITYELAVVTLDAMEGLWEAMRKQGYDPTPLRSPT